MSFNPTPQFSGFQFSRMQPMYLWDSSLGKSGVYRPVTPTDLASVVNISGTNVTVDLDDAIGITGTVYTVIQNPIAISGGNINANLGNNYVNVTGNINSTIIGGTLNVNVTGTGMETSNYTTSSVATIPLQFNTQNNFSISGTAQTVFTLTSGSAGFVRNLDINPLYVKFGTSGNSISFSDILFGGSITGDGKGGYINIDNWVGPVSVSGNQYIAYKLNLQ